MMVSSSLAQIHIDGTVENIYSDTTLMNKYDISDPTAVCNDGSPSVYYLSEGDPTSWLIYLEGGGRCVF